MVLIWMSERVKRTRLSREAKMSFMTGRMSVTGKGRERTRVSMSGTVTLFGKTSGFAEDKRVGRLSFDMFWWYWDIIFAAASIISRRVVSVPRKRR
jgi:hypothetical protein